LSIIRPPSYCGRPFPGPFVGILRGTRNKRVALLLIFQIIALFSHLQANLHKLPVYNFGAFRRLVFSHASESFRGMVVISREGITLPHHHTPGLAGPLGLLSGE
jgi:hypothetical protein